MITELKYKPTSQEGWYVLTEDLHYTTRIADIHSISASYARDLARKSGLAVDQDIVITVPKGFLTDLASVPKLFHGIAPPDGPWEAASVIHDFLYQLRHRDISMIDSNCAYSVFESHLNRFISDKIFHLAMLDSGVGRVTASAFFNAVRAGGSRFFRKPTDAPILAGDVFHMAEPYAVVREVVSPAIPKDHYYSVTGKMVNIKYYNHGRPIYGCLLEKEEEE